MTQKFEDVWDEVQESLVNAKGIGFDGCHKIYVLMDDEQMHLMASYGYGQDEDGSFLINAQGTTTNEMLDTLKKWYEQSCALRFIQAVETVEEDPNLGFDNLIPQGYEAEFCTDCEKFGADATGYCYDCQEAYEEDEPEEDEDEDE